MQPTLSGARHNQTHTESLHRNAERFTPRQCSFVMSNVCTWVHCQRAHRGPETDVEGFTKIQQMCFDGIANLRDSVPNYVVRSPPSSTVDPPRDAHLFRGRVNFRDPSPTGGVMYFRPRHQNDSLTCQENTLVFHVAPTKEIVAHAQTKSNRGRRLRLIRVSILALLVGTMSSSPVDVLRGDAHPSRATKYTKVLANLSRWKASGHR